MSEYNVHLKWQRTTADFDYETYDRKHTVFFYGGPKIEMDSAPNMVRNPQFQTPEELLIAALSSCFMLTFLSLAANEHLIVNSYQDNATCVLGLNEAKVIEVILRPSLVFEQGYKPEKAVLTRLFKTAREHCFIANSLATDVTVNPSVS